MSSEGSPVAGRRAIVTGASSGVGAATAVALCEAGWDVALVARRQDRLTELVARPEQSGCRAIAIPADLSQAAAAAAAMKKAQRDLGPVHALVLCHGTNVPRRRLEELSVEDWDGIITANLSSMFYCFRAVAPGMRERGFGRVVAISSVAARWPSMLGGAGYAASKAGLNAFCSVLDQEERAHGIRATVIDPGDIDTEIMDKRPQPPDPEARTRMLRSDDIARLVVQVLMQPEHVFLEEIVVRPSHV